ncbi:IS3 family transposase, partial [Serratia sp. MF2]|uniref:IS3 family transposase n=1 Tax=Serratia sp. MF2 TaxID=3059173 RepID=UPI0027F4B3F2
YELARRAEFTLVKTMLDKALGKLKPDEQPVLHSDQGWHYRMAAYHHQLRENGLQQSLSRTGNCRDNAVMENVFGHLKAELYYLHRFDNVEHLAIELESYIEYYSPSRLREHLKGLSPVEYRPQALKAAGIYLVQLLGVSSRWCAPYHRMTSGI